MSLKKVLWVAVGFQLLAVSWVSAAWQESIYGPPWCDPANNIGCSLPITALLINQVKVGGFGTQGPLSAPWVFPTLKLGVGSVVTGSALDTTAVNETVAVLDVNGQIRIRGGCPGCDGQVLTAANNNGLAQWKSLSSITSISQDTVNRGIILTPNPIYNTGTIGIKVASAGGLSINAWDQLKVNVGVGLEVNASNYLQFSPCSISCPYLITKFGGWHCSPPPGSRVVCI